MTFLEVKTLWNDYAKRPDLSTLVGNFINMAQMSLERKHNFRHMEKQETGVLASGVYTHAIPSSYKESKYFRVLVSGEWKEVNKESLEYATAWQPDLTNNVGRPRIFAARHADNKFLLRPTTDRIYSYDHYYYAYTTALAQDADTNWWTTNAWDVLLFGALMEGRALMKDHDDIPLWESKFREGKNDIVKAYTDETFRGSAPKQKADFIV